MVTSKLYRGVTSCPLVLPWRFRDEFVAREADFIANDGHLIFPLPEFEVVGNRRDLKP
jgi:hypothetical protein